MVVGGGWLLVVCGWWLVVVGCWLVVGGWWLVVGIILSRQNGYCNSNIKVLSIVIKVVKKLRYY